MNSTSTTPDPEEERQPVEPLEPSEAGEVAAPAPDETAAMPPPEEAAGPAGDAVAAEPAGPSFGQRLGRFFFSSETRFGRFNRALLRYTVIILAALAIGAGLIYFLLYQPYVSSAQAELQTTSARLDESQSLLEAARQENDELRAQAEEAMTALEAANARVQVLKVLHHTSVARLALMDKNGPAAQQALTAAKTELERLLPLVRQIDGELADLLKGRLELAIGELTRDPKAALSDLEILSRMLELQEKFFAGE